VAWSGGLFGWRFEGVALVGVEHGHPSVVAGLGLAAAADAALEFFF